MPVLRTVRSAAAPLAVALSIVLFVGPALAVAAEGDDRPAVSTLAGARDAGNRDGVAGAARFGSPDGVAVAGDGTVYVSDAAYNTIRTVDRSGTVRTVAGPAGATGMFPAGGFANGAATGALFNRPAGLAFGKGGVLYIADAGNHAVRVLRRGTVATLAGGPAKGGGADGPAGAAQFGAPTALAVDAGGDVFVADIGNGVRRISNGAVTTFLRDPSVTGIAVSGRLLFVASKAGIASYDYASSGPAIRTAGIDSATVQGHAPLGFPYALAAIDGGRLVFTDVRTNTVRALTAMEALRVLAGAADWDPSTGSGGFADGDGTRALFNAPAAIAIRSDGSVVVADAGNHRVRAVSAWDKTYYVSTDGQGLDRFAPGPSEDGIAWVGNSQAWSDTDWHDSIEGTLQRELASSRSYQGTKRRPRLIPMVYPAAGIDALASAIKTYFAGGLVKAVVFQINSSSRRTSNAELTTVLRELDATLKAAHVKLIVITHPDGPQLSPDESRGVIVTRPGYELEAARSEYRAVVEAVKASGVSFYDAYPDFERAEADGDTPLFGTDDPHLTDRGRALMARAGGKALTTYFFAERAP